jgi:hypothetical protein
MATWRAKCWLGSSSGYQELEVQSNTLNGAKEQFERIYGAEQIINLREVRSSGNSSSSDSGDVGGYLILGAILFGIWLLVEYWWIVVPVVAILGLLVWYGSQD